MNIINLTPHTINIVTKEGKEIKQISSSGTVRISTESKQFNVIHSIPIFQTEYGNVEGLPPEQSNILYIVSALVKTACPHRKDLVSPSQLQRDKNGNVIGCLGLE